MLSELEARKAKTGEKPYKLTDGRGLYLLVTPRGGKLWRLDYRFSGKRKTIALGQYPDVSLAMAREKRDEARRLLVQGIDPGEHRKATRSAQRELEENTFEAVAREFVAKMRPTWAASHADRTLRRLERDVFPWIGNRPVREITAPEILTVVRRIEERGALETAHRALQNIHQVLRYSIAVGRAERSPAADLKGALPPVKSTHFAAPTDPARLGALLRAIESYEGSFIIRCALRLAPLVFVRPGELRAIRWSDVDFDRAEWRYRVTKTTTDHVVPLSRQALAILGEIRPLTGHGEHVFPSHRTLDGSRPMSDVALLAALRRMGFDRTEATVHGLRATARTLLDEVLGFPPHLIEHQLAHTVRDPLGRAYNRTSHLPERKKMMQRWADYLDGPRDGADILPFSATRSAL